MLEEPNGEHRPGHLPHVRQVLLPGPRSPQLARDGRRGLLAVNELDHARRFLEQRRFIRALPRCRCEQLNHRDSRGLLLGRRALGRVPNDGLPVGLLAPEGTSGVHRKLVLGGLLGGLQRGDRVTHGSCLCR